MGFLWGKKDEFEKGGNTLREVYNFKPSLGHLDKKKYYKVPIIEYSSNSTSENYSICGGMAFSNSMRTLSSYTESFFFSESTTESYKMAAGMAYKNSEITRNSFVEYYFFSYPYTGYMPETYAITGGIAYKLEVVS